MLREATSRVAGEALALAAGCLFRTLHFEVVGRDPVLALAAAGRAVVLVGWHGHDLIHLAAFPTLLPGRRGAIIVEDNVAGHALMVSAARWKVDGTALSLAADSTRSARGIVRFVALVRSGRFGLLAVDGPAGPARQVKPGAAFIALRAEAVLVPCASAVRPAIELPRWDRHLVPLPFARGLFVMGEAIDTRVNGASGRPHTVDSLTLQIARSLAEVGARAETLRGSSTAR